jgi:hypothetical protein
MKMTNEIAARMAQRARILTCGAYGVMTSAPSGRDPKITDVKAGMVWQGPDNTRQAAAFYAGLVAQLSVDIHPEVRRVLAEVGGRHGRYVEDGRGAARTWAAAVRDVASSAR